MLPDLAEACRKSGLTVHQLPGWQHKGRPGSFDPRGVLVHHTGGTSNARDYVEWMQNVGRSDLPAPLCQLALDRNGLVYVLAAGRANHGGTARATGPMPAGDANSLYIGIEALNTGSEGWTPPQYDAYVALCAALCDHYGWPATHVRAHRETSVTGKWDPGLLDMDRFRNDIATRLNTKGLTMDQEVKAAFADISGRLASLEKIAGRSANREIRTNKHLRTLVRKGSATKADLEELLAILEGADASPRS